MEYDVFISCKSEDYKYAEEIYDFLTQNGIKTFLASKELRRLGESEYRREISKAMKSTYHLIVFASVADYIDATWVEYEWDMFVNAKLKGFKQGNIMTILKDIRVDEINMDLWKYESFSFENYKDSLLQYVETPASKQRAEEQKNQASAKQEAERTQAKKELVAIAEEFSAKMAITAKRIIAIQKKLGITTRQCPVCEGDVKIGQTYCPTCGWHFSPIEGIEGAEYLSADPDRLSLSRKIYQASISGSKDAPPQFGQNTNAKNIGINQNCNPQTITAAPPSFVEKFATIFTDERAVDLGLSVKWASCNVGASSPEDFGGLYGWGDATGTKTSTDLGDYPSSNPPSNICGDSRYDIARARLGGTWRLPTLNEIKELIDHCTWERKKINGVDGYEVTGPNGNSIYLPAAGSRSGTKVKRRGFRGYYWSGELNAQYSYGAYELNFDNSRHDWYNDYRYNGHSVRAVTEYIRESSEK